MAKATLSETSRSTVWSRKATVCQCCKAHTNKPSFCKAFNKSVGRKQDATDCEKFDRVS